MTMQSVSIPLITKGDQDILSSFTFHFKYHGWTTILGQSGVGKTTLLRQLAGLELKAENIFCQEMGLMPQRDILLPWKNILKNVVLRSILLGVKPDLEKAKQLLNDMGLGKHFYSYPSELSIGMKQRCMLARALYEDKKILLLDEPFSALDPPTRQSMIGLIQSLCQERSIIMVSHDIFDAVDCSDVIHVMKGKPSFIGQTFYKDFPENIHLQIHGLLCATL